MDFWTNNFFDIFIVIVLVLLFIPNWKTKENERYQKSDESLSDVWKNKFFRSTIPLGLFNYGGLVAIQTLWAGPWMVKVAGYTPLQSATGLLWIATTMLIQFTSYFMGSSYKLLNR